MTNNAACRQAVWREPHGVTNGVTPDATAGGLRWTLMDHRAERVRSSPARITAQLRTDEGLDPTDHTVDTQ